MAVPHPNSTRTPNATLCSSEIQRRGHWKRGICIKLSKSFSNLRQLCDNFAYETKCTQFCANVACNLRQICATPPARTSPLSQILRSKDLVMKRTFPSSSSKLNSFKMTFAENLGIHHVQQIHLYLRLGRQTFASAHKT